MTPTRITSMRLVGGRTYNVRIRPPRGNAFRALELVVTGVDPCGTVLDIALHCTSLRPDSRIWFAVATLVNDVGVVTAPFARGRVDVTTALDEFSIHNWMPQNEEYRVVVRASHSVTVRSVARRPMILLVCA